MQRHCGEDCEQQRVGRYVKARFPDALHGDRDESAHSSRRTQFIGRSIASQPVPGAD